MVQSNGPMNIFGSANKTKKLVRYYLYLCRSIVYKTIYDPVCIIKSIYDNSLLTEKLSWNGIYTAFQSKVGIRLSSGNMLRYAGS